MSNQPPSDTAEHSLFYESLQNAPFGCVVASTDAEGRILYVNPKFTDMTGYSHSDVPTVTDWITRAYPDPEYRQHVMGNWEADTSPQNRDRDVIYKITCRQGQVKDIQLRAGFLDPDRMFVMLLDATDRVQAERELIHSKDRYRNLVKDLRTGLVVHTEKGVEFINPYAVELLGGSNPADFFGRDVLDFVHPDSRKEVLDRIGMLTSGQTTAAEPHEEKFVGMDGRTLDVTVTGSPIEYGGKPAIQVLFTDITDQKKAQSERRRLDARVAATQKIESLAVMAGGIAHDFNNLLVGILGNADLALQDLSGDSPQKRHLLDISTAAHQAAELAHQLLAYSGRGQMTMASLDLAVLLNDLSSLIQASISKNVTIRYELADDIPPIQGDGTQIRQIVMNLVANGAESLDDAEGVITVSTGFDHFEQKSLADTPIVQDVPDGDYVWLKVADTGMGMDETTLQRIFEPFFTTKFTGRGLGLAAILGIVRGHRGAVQVESHQDQGTRFRVLFPPSPDVLFPGDIKAEVKRSDPAAGGLVLVVDDDRSVNKVASMMLSRAGYEVLNAYDGKEAVRIFRDRSEDLDCVILDLTMPRMNGSETCRAIKRIRDVPVILSSGYNEEEVLNAFADLELAGFVQKPYLYDTLIDCVGNTITDKSR